MIYSDNNEGLKVIKGFFQWSCLHSNKVSNSNAGAGILSVGNIGALALKVKQDSTQCSD